MSENDFAINKNVVDLSGKKIIKGNLDRVNKNLKVTFFFGNSFYFGTAMNLSEKYMLIKTEILFPVNYIFDVFIPLSEEVLKVTAKIIRVDKSEDVYDIMAAELLNPDNKYLEFLKCLRSA